MKYFFDGRIESNGDIYTIKIPFNVWEVCKLRDVIQADVLLDNKMIHCELLPEKKGNYKIHLKEEDISHTDPGQVHKILLHISGSLIRMDQNSPYSTENPIRRIDGINLINQTVDGLCGQTCIAMLAGVTVAEVMSVMDCREWQGTMGRMISALNYYGIEHAEVINYTEGREVILPKCCIMMERMGLYCHYLIHYDGKFYDPNFEVFEEYDLKKLMGYLEVKCV